MAGVKGPCSLGCLKSFDLIKGMSPDYMHCALLGVSKMLLHLWTDTSRCRGTLHNLHADVALLDRRIKDIEVPSEIHRKPRGISDLKQWKGMSTVSAVLTSHNNASLTTPTSSHATTCTTSNKKIS